MKRIKKLMEQRDALKEKLERLLDAADAENRALTEEEAAEFDAAETEIRALDETIAREERARKLGNNIPAGGENEEEQEAGEEERAFVDYVLGRNTEQRAGGLNMKMDDNGAIVPVSIASKIIQEVYDRCPILEGATHYNVKGTIRIPVWGKANGTHDIAVGYQKEFEELVPDTGAFSGIELSGHLAGALAVISRSLENNGTFSVATFIIGQIAETVSRFLEKELLSGAGTNAAEGALSTSNTLTTAGANITADDLIDLQAKVKQVYQANAHWTMHPDTFTSLKKLKDGNGRYLLQDDVTGEFPYRILGKGVYVSDNMPAIAAGKPAVLYGDYTGLSVNFRENISIEVLREKYATMHALGVVSWFEFDSRITEHQKLAALKMKA